MIIAAEQAKAGDKVAAAEPSRRRWRLPRHRQNRRVRQYHTTTDRGLRGQGGDIEGARKIAEAIEHETRGIMA